MSLLFRPRMIIETYPKELLEHLIRRFNAVAQQRVLAVRSHRFEIYFETFENHNHAVIVKLFTRLVQALNSIKSKYLDTTELSVHVSIRMIERENMKIIRISGANKIPPGKLFNLFSLIMWYHIKYISGAKPSASKYGRQLRDSWKEEEAYTRKELNSSEKKVVVIRDPRPCHICGKSAEFLNTWQFYYKKERRYIQMHTHTCEKHKSEVI